MEIVLYEEILEDFIGEDYFSLPNFTNNNSTLDNKYKKRSYAKTSFSNKNYSQLLNWRPQGRLLCTLYNYEEPVEKLIPFCHDHMNKFLSIGSNGRIIFWDVRNNDNDTRVEILSEYKTHDMKYNTATPIDNSKFAVANNSNQIEICKVIITFYTLNRLRALNPSLRFIICITLIRIL